MYVAIVWEYCSSIAIFEISNLTIDYKKEKPAKWVLNLVCREKVFFTGLTRLVYQEYAFVLGIYTLKLLPDV